MDIWPPHPTLYEINTWVWLREQQQAVGRPLTLADIPDVELERLGGLGFDGVWLMGVWSRSPAAREVARTHPELQPGYREALPDHTDADTIASPYAVLDYQVDPELGGDTALATLRRRLRALGLRLILDFVPNHLARDHPWVSTHPERLVQGGREYLDRQPHNYFEQGGRVFAHGRDPYFSGWTDTVQVDFRPPACRRAMADQLLAVAERCDGLRCDMAMLVNREVFSRTWGGAFDPPWAEFWPAAITDIKARFPGFLMLAEAYWDMGWDLQQMGFDYTYDKRLYDRLWEGNATPVRLHLLADWSYQRRLARFVENHDEQRAATAFGPQRNRSAALLSLTLPGLRLVHEGQLQGWRRRLPVQLARRQAEPTDPALETFYQRLLAELIQPVFHRGRWRLLDAQQARPGDVSHGDLIAHTWTLGEERRLVVVNLSPQPARCRLNPDPDASEGRWQARELLGNDCPSLEAPTEELNLELPGHGYGLFEVTAA